MPDSNLDQWRHEPVSKLISCPPPAATPGDAERHAIFAYALMAITHHYWNGNKYGRGVLYPLNTVTDPTMERGPAGGDYLGHNIAALAVDARGNIIDFDFNHNEVFNSSVEHAESRLLRRLFSLALVQDSWQAAASAAQRAAADVPGYYANVLAGVTVYTTLESCAQCSGIMALAKLGQVVFLQTDPGQYSVGNIMRNMTVNTGLPAPQPIPASSFGFKLHDSLDDEYRCFRQRGASKPMVTGPGGALIGASATTSITSFLCTKAAQDIFAAGAIDLQNIKATHPLHRPQGAPADALTNDAALAEARAFVRYAITSGQRGTPHRA